MTRRSSNYACSASALIAIVTVQPVNAQSSPQITVDQCADYVQNDQNTALTAAEVFANSLQSAQRLIDNGQPTDLTNFISDDGVSFYLKKVVDSCKRALGIVEQGGTISAPSNVFILSSLPRVDQGGGAVEGLINSAIASNPGKWIYIPAGNYKLGGSILMIDNTKLIADHQAVFFRSWDAGGGTTGELVTSPFKAGKICPSAATPCVVLDESGSLPTAADGSAYPAALAYRTMINPVNPTNGAAIAANNVQIIGGTWRGSDWSGARHAGRPFTWYGNNWKLTGLFVSGWAAAGKPAFAISWVGNGTRIKHVVMRDPQPIAGVDCLHLMGGSNTELAYLDMVCGDDTIAAAPQTRNPANQTVEGKFPEVNIWDLNVHDARTVSHVARVFSIGLPNYTIGDDPQQPARNSYVANVRLSNIVGFALGLADGTVEDFGAGIPDLGSAFVGLDASGNPLPAVPNSGVRDYTLTNIEVYGRGSSADLAGANNDPFDLSASGSTLRYGIKSTGGESSPAQAKVKLNGRLVIDNGPLQNDWQGATSTGARYRIQCFYGAENSTSFNVTTVDPTGAAYQCNK